MHDLNQVNFCIELEETPAFSKSTTFLMELPQWQLSFLYFALALSWAIHNAASPELLTGQIKC